MELFGGLCVGVEPVFDYAKVVELVRGFDPDFGVEGITAVAVRVRTKRRVVLEGHEVTLICRDRCVVAETDSSVETCL
jgi:hypothetical protein